MIDPNTLMRNNIVLFRGIESEVEEITGDEIRLNISGDLHYFSYMQIYPIPLTPEILERCGFVKSNTLLSKLSLLTSWQLDIGRNRVLSVCNVATPNEMIFISEEEPEKRKVNDVIVIKNYDYDGYTHLHTLQNLLSILGHPLELTPAKIM